MKNIHIIPTDKPSRLAKHSSGSFHIVSYIAHKKGLYKMTNQYIYITSDEEIKERDWCYAILSRQIFQNINPNLKSEDKKKIILTTDSDLIKDGVQAIDDEFLEWFVKNPSCEEVPIIIVAYLNKSTYRTNIGFEKWRIGTIPKEEPNNKH
jgi:hypothetical protein